MVSYNTTGENEQSTDNTKMKLLRVITPTHWMQVAESVDGKFAFAIGGTYSVQAGKVTAKNQIGTVPYDVNSKEEVELTYKIEGDKVYQKGVYTEADGSSHIFSDVFEKVRSKTAKTLLIDNNQFKPQYL
jgi:hypothetical protein